jgi:prepilin peptidase CpaA
VNLIEGAPAWLVWIFAATVVAAAIEDAVRLRISNVTCALVVIEAVAAIVMSGWSVDLWQNFALFALILALGTAAFAAGLFGGGDVKLLTATGLWLDLRGGLLLLAAIFVSGGIVAIGYLATSFVRRQKTSLNSRRVPYGIAIAIGALFTIAVVRESGAAQPHSQAVVRP